MPKDHSDVWGFEAGIRPAEKGRNEHNELKTEKVRDSLEWVVNSCVDEAREETKACP
jgi:hypothetical protein